MMMLVRMIMLLMMMTMNDDESCYGDHDDGGLGDDLSLTAESVFVFF